MFESLYLLPDKFPHLKLELVRLLVRRLRPVLDVRTVLRREEPNDVRAGFGNSDEVDLSSNHVSTQAAHDCVESWDLVSD